MALTVTGAERVKTVLRIWVGAVSGEVRAALEAEGQRLLNTASPLTPRDTGNLRRSAHVKEAPSSRPGRPVVWAQMGGEANSGDPEVGETGTNEEDVFYAWIQHENLTFNHSVGQAKYLSTALARRKARIESAITDDVHRRLINKLKGIPGAG